MVLAAISPPFLEVVHSWAHCAWVSTEQSAYVLVLIDPMYARKSMYGKQDAVHEALDTQVDQKTNRVEWHLLEKISPISDHLVQGKWDTLPIILQL